MRFRVAALAAAALLFAAMPTRAGIVLEASTDALELITSTTASLDYNCSWTDSTTSAFTPGKSAGNIASATTTTIVAAPASATQRNILNCTFRNASTSTANALTLQRDVSGTNRTMFSASLAPGETLQLTQDGEFQVLSASGALRTQSVDSGYDGRAYYIAKGGTAKDAAGYWIAYAKDAGQPGPYSLGSPGLNGWTTDCSAASNAADPAGAAQLGANVLQDPATGSLYLTAVTLADTVAEIVELVDVLWYNTGAVVTTTTIQGITTPTLPARDLTGSTNGEGIYAALLTTTANTNGAAISNTTINYTDSDGNTGNTGTFMAQVGWQAPATPVIGTWMRFQLAAGDRGIRAITSASSGGLTLGTSYGAGALSLVLYRPLVTLAVTSANLGTTITFPAPGIKIFPNSCLWVVSGGSVTAANVIGSYTIAER